MPLIIDGKSPKPKSVEVTDIDYQDKQTVHLAVYRGHFVPILPKLKEFQVFPDLPNGIGANIYSLLDAKNQAAFNKVFKETVNYQPYSQRNRIQALREKFKEQDVKQKLDDFQKIEKSQTLSERCKQLAELLVALQLEYTDFPLIFRDDELLGMLTASAKAYFGYHHPATLQGILQDQTLREEYFNLIRGSDRKLFIPVTPQYPAQQFPVKILDHDFSSKINYVLFTLADRYPENLGQTILDNSELSSRLDGSDLAKLANKYPASFGKLIVTIPGLHAKFNGYSSALREIAEQNPDDLGVEILQRASLNLHLQQDDLVVLGLKHPQLAKKIMETKSLAERLPEEQTKSRPTSLASQIVGAVAGAFIAAVTQPFILLLTLPVGIGRRAKANVGLAIVLGVMALIMLPLIYIGLSVPSMFCALIRGAYCGWNGGIQRVMNLPELPKMMWQEAQEGVTRHVLYEESSSDISERKDSPLVFMLSLAGVVSKKYWNPIPATTVMQQAEKAGGDYMPPPMGCYPEEEQAGFPNPAPVELSYDPSYDSFSVFKRTPKEIAPKAIEVEACSLFSVDQCEHYPRF